MIRKPSRIGATRVKVGDILVYGTDKFVVRNIVWHDPDSTYWFYDERGRVLVLPAHVRAICWKTSTWGPD